jgi:hypothetical protein
MKNEQTIKVNGSYLTLTQQAMKKCREMLRQEILRLNGDCESKQIGEIMESIDHYACLCITNAQEMRNEDRINRAVILADEVGIC